MEEKTSLYTTLTPEEKSCIAQVIQLTPEEKQNFEILADYLIDASIESLLQEKTLQKRQESTNLDMPNE